jgi:hypothetical protein
MLAKVASGFSVTGIQESLYEAAVMAFAPCSSAPEKVSLVAIFVLEGRRLIKKHVDGRGPLFLETF